MDSRPDLKYYQNNAFYLEKPVQGPFRISYQCSGKEKDILIKVYTLDCAIASHVEVPLELEDWEKWENVQNFHSSSPRCTPERFEQLRISQTSYLGIQVHRDINIDGLWNMKPEEQEKNLRRSTEGGWQGHDEVPARRTAQGTDFILSQATSNNQQNNEMLKSLTAPESHVRGPHESGPITFCTDRSLGLGQHFERREQQHALYLGKHVFGAAVEKGAWFEEYKKAADLVKYGILIVNPNMKYFDSPACRKEISTFNNLRVYRYDAVSKMIKRCGKDDAKKMASTACKDDPEAIREKVLQVLRDAYPKALSTQKLEEACGFTKALAKKMSARPKSWLNPILYKMPEIEHTVHAHPEGKPLWRVKCGFN
jgi:hypothetical protein